MKKQLLIITMLVSAGASTGLLAHTQAQPVPNKTGASLTEDLLEFRKNEKKGKGLTDKWKTLVANTSTVDLEVQVGTSKTWERVPKGHYRTFFYLVPKLNIRKAGESDPQKTLSLQGDQDNAVTLIESVYGDGNIKEYQSARPRDTQINIIQELQTQHSELADKYVREKDPIKAKKIFEEYQEIGEKIEQLKNDLYK